MVISTKTGAVILISLVFSLACLWGCGGGESNTNTGAADAQAVPNPDANQAGDIQEADMSNKPGLAPPSDASVEESDSTTKLEDTSEPKTEDSSTDTKPSPNTDTNTEPLGHCEGLGLPIAQLNTEGPFGHFRHNLADDFEFYPLKGNPWLLSENWTGCDVYIFIPSAKTKSQTDATSIWENDLAGLIAGSPRNVHYFFMATSSSKVMESLEAMQTRIENFLASLSESEAEFWGARLHVSGGSGAAFPGWLGKAFKGPSSSYGLAIDRHQRVRLNGSFADVTRYSQALSDAGGWPWEANMAYAAHEARQYNYEALRDAKLASEDNLTIVSAWEDEVLKGSTEKEVEFPDAETMSTFDTLHIDLTMDCPDPELGEFGNCGAWDYLSHIYLETQADPQEWTEISRFITTYHREGRYLVDATGALPHFLKGGTLKLKFDASSQSYRTKMDFRFRNAGKGYRPVGSHYLWSGRGFNADYNDYFEDQEILIPATTKRVELWAIITGHGMSSTHNCAEFCDHQHFFDVNGAVYARTHDVVGNQVGCIDQIENGMVPNQGGTWWFGRGGWCPGQQVDPFVVDITEDMTPGESLSLAYEAKMNGASIPDGSGNIRMSSWLVFFE